MSDPPRPLWDDLVVSQFEIGQGWHARLAGRSALKFRHS